MVLYQVTNEHFEAESQAVCFSEVLQLFRLNGNFLVICLHLDLTHSSFSSPRMHCALFHVCVPAQRFIYIHTNVPMYSWHTLVILSQEHFSHKVAPGCVLAVQSFPSVPYQGALYLICRNHKPSLPLELTGEQSSQSI